MIRSRQRISQYPERTELRPLVPLEHSSTRLGRHQKPAGVGQALFTMIPRLVLQDPLPGLRDDFDGVSYCIEHSNSEAIYMSLLQSFWSSRYAPLWIPVPLLIPPWHLTWGRILHVTFNSLNEYSARRKRKARLGSPGTSREKRGLGLFDGVGLLKGKKISGSGTAICLSPNPLR